MQASPLLKLVDHFHEGASIWAIDSDLDSDSIPIINNINVNNYWIRATIIEYNQSKTHIKVQYHTEHDQLVNKQFALDGPAQIYPRNTTLLEDNLDDLTCLSHLNEPAVLNTIRFRYNNDTIYTFSGIVLTALNPYKKLDLYDYNFIKIFMNDIEYSNSVKNENIPNNLNGSNNKTSHKEPHLYAIGQAAYKDLLGRNQSIIISGESGAGKTMSARYIMRFLAAEQTIVGPIEERVLATNPILEAFGNAKTLRNDNSSRFGKYVQIWFSDERTRMLGATIKTFLLEKTRVITQSIDERNYHIFYQMIANRKMSMKYSLENQKFNYINRLTINDVDDEKEFETTIRSLEVAGFTMDQRNLIFDCLAAILYLGNIDIQKDGKDDCSYIDPDDESLIKSAQLLRIDSSSLRHWLMKRKLTTGSDVIEINQTKDQSTVARDAFSKHLYSLLFDMIVECLNKSLIPPPSTSKFIGVLDIYGFEKFPRNSFEQFCINYANEKLQNLFIQQIFQLEQELYQKENIKWSFIDFVDNRPCIDLIEGKFGILSILDEECKFPNGTDKSFVDKLEGCYSSNIFMRNKFNPLLFTIKHFAYDVEYDADGFLDKNRDFVSFELLNLISSSLLFPSPSPSPSPSHSNDQKNQKINADASHLIKKATTGSGFKASLNSLLEIITSTQVHYIRCIKPNETKSANLFDSRLVLQQLRACGIIETVRISAAGYPGRWNFHDFYSRFRILDGEKNLLISINDISNFKEACKRLLNSHHIKIEDDEYQIGISQIFLRAGVLAKLERLRVWKLNHDSIKIQTIFHCYRNMNNLNEIRKSIQITCNFVKCLVERKRFFHLLKMKISILLQALYRVHSSHSYYVTCLANSNLLATFLRIKIIKTNVKWKICNRSGVAIQIAFRCYQADLEYNSNRTLLVSIQSYLRIFQSFLIKKQLKAENNSVKKTSHLAGQVKSLKKQLLERDLKIQLLLKELEESNKMLEDATSVANKAAENLERERKEISTLGQREIGYSTQIEDLENKNVSLQYQLSDAQNLIIKLKTKFKEMKLQDKSSTNSQFSHQNQFEGNKIKLENGENHVITNEIENSILDSNNNIHPPPSSHQHQRSLSLEFSRPSREELRILLHEKIIFEELQNVCKNAKIPKSNVHHDERMILIPSEMIERWICCWFELEREPLLINEHFKIILDLIRKCPSSISATIDRKFSYWISNTIRILRGLQSIITDHGHLDNNDQDDPDSNNIKNHSQEIITKAVNNSNSKLTGRVLSLLQMRSESAKLVEELFRSWLADLIIWFGQMSCSAIMEYQGLYSYKSIPPPTSYSNGRVEDGGWISNDKERNERHFSIKGLFGINDSNDRHEDNNSVSIDILISSLNELLSAMKSCWLSQEISYQILIHTFSHIEAICFNILISRKGYASWRRGIQIQYNLSQLEEWIQKNQLGPILISILDPLLQSVKLLQLAKTCGPSDSDIILKTCQRLNPSQIRRILQLYVPDEFEDGPVPIELIESIPVEGGEGEKLFKKEIRADEATLQLSIIPIMPMQDLASLKPNAPPNLWRLFVMYYSMTIDSNDQI